MNQTTSTMRTHRQPHDPKQNKTRQTWGGNCEKLERKHGGIPRERRRWKRSEGCSRHGAREREGRSQQALPPHATRRRRAGKLSGTPEMTRARVSANGCKQARKDVAIEPTSRGRKGGGAAHQEEGERRDHRRLA
eukprot:186322-Rhodomonas_salina.1